MVGQWIPYFFLSGYYDDNWVAPTVELDICSGEQGMIQVEGYYPQELHGTEAIEVYVNNEKVMTYRLESSNIAFNVPCIPNQRISLRFEANFSVNNVGGDLRSLCWLLTQISGE